ncbi:MAG: hypothetical protein AAF530_14175 [Pseudomonadota bacterium]
MSTQQHAIFSALKMDSNLIRVWKEASEDLGFEIQAPFLLQFSPNRSIAAHFLVPNFGARNGMIIVTDYRAIAPFVRDIVALGYGYSTFGDYADGTQYDRDTYIKILSDWGWTGEERDRPAWIAPFDEELAE